MLGAKHGEPNVWRVDVDVCLVVWFDLVVWICLVVWFDLVVRCCGCCRCGGGGGVER